MKRALLAVALTLAAAPAFAQSALQPAQFDLLLKWTEEAALIAALIALGGSVIVILYVIRGIRWLMKVI